MHLRPVLVKKFLPFAFMQQIAGAASDEHPQTSPLFDQLLVDQLLISLEHCERIHAVIGSDIAHRRQRITFFEYAIENHVYDAIAELAINWLSIIPFTIHPMFQTRV